MLKSTLSKMTAAQMKWLPSATTSPQPSGHNTRIIPVASPERSPQRGLRHVSGVKVTEFMTCLKSLTRDTQVLPAHLLPSNYPVIPALINKAK